LGLLEVSFLSGKNLFFLWFSLFLVVVFSFSGCGFVGVCLDVIRDQSRCFVVNVYAKCNLVDKRRLWGEILMSKRGFGGGRWCIVGDFNSVRDSSERRGVHSVMSYSQSREMAEFDFVLDRVGIGRHAVNW
jgi:hypothetical protein